MTTNNATLENVNTIRVCAAFFIFLCHAFSGSNSSIGIIIGQLFNVGVPIFFMISGFLYNGKAKPYNTIRWYLKRLKKILIPLYIFLIVLLIVYFVKKLDIVLVSWIFNFIPVCGLTETYISGCGHLWFITHIFICYLLAPIFQKKNKINAMQFFMVLVGYLLLNLIFACLQISIINTLLHSMFSFFLGFYILPKIKTNSLLFLPVGLVAVLVRLAGRFLFDGSMFYNIFIVDLSQKMLGIAVIGFFCFLFSYMKEKSNNFYNKNNCITKKLSVYTFEFYIVHYIFLSGNLKVNYFNSYIFNCLTAFLLSILFAFILHGVTILINKLLKGKT